METCGDPEMIIATDRDIFSTNKVVYIGILELRQGRRSLSANIPLHINILCQSPSESAQCSTPSARPPPDAVKHIRCVRSAVNIDHIRGDKRHICKLDDLPALAKLVLIAAVEAGVLPLTHPGYNLSYESTNVF